MRRDGDVDRTAAMVREDSQNEQNPAHRRRYQEEVGGHAFGRHEMRRRIVLGALVAISALSLAGAGAQGQPGGPKVTKLVTLSGGGNLYVINGGGGNSVALVTNSGIVLVDTKLDGWGRPILDALNGVTDQPVTTIINTHAHGDHTGSNHEFPSVVNIIAHENTKVNMAKMDAFKGANAKFLPTKTFKDTMSLGSGSDQVDLYYFGAGHTNGDTIVVFPAARAAYVGDLFTGRSAPIIDSTNGGSGVAYPETLAKAMATIKDVTAVIPGHDLPPLDPKRTTARAREVLAWSSWGHLREFADFTRDFLIAAQEARKAGKSVEQAAAALKPKLAEKYKDYSMERATANVEAIYNELKN